MTIEQPKQPMNVTFVCSGKASGKMRNDFKVTMTEPLEEHFTLASDEGPFHGGESTAPAPLALFIAGLTGCIMTQLRAFAKRMDVTVDDLRVETKVQWGWIPLDRIYETFPKSFDMDIFLESPSPIEDQVALIKAARKGCFVEQTLGQVNSITHRISTPDGFLRIK